MRRPARLSIDYRSVSALLFCQLRRALGSKGTTAEGIRISPLRRLVPGLFCMALAGSAAAMDGRISGHVRTDGEALDGAMVTARAVASGIETTVFSGDDGAYYLGSLDPGTYEVEAKIPGRSAPRRTLAIGGGEIASGRRARRPAPGRGRPAPRCRALT